ncbi:MAG: phosphatidylserine decarboxylase family protein [Deltaproteobacteria bacterium]|nr:MAG: phosphatidylserine decarboxylase family protein [Deltaproteobacteria bacterium]
MEAKKIDNKLPIAREGIPFILTGIGLTCVFLILDLLVLAIPLAVLTSFIIFFFRDPERDLVNSEKAVLTPADGKIIAIERLTNGDNRFPDTAVKLSIFMSVFNAHINRIPVGGRISQLTYHPGKFFSANLDKASLHNENNMVLLETDNREKIVLVQVAGLIARRIVCWVKAGDYVKTGQRFGLIRFGSRLEVYLPPDSTITVRKGEKVKAGQTIIGYLR